MSAPTGRRRTGAVLASLAIAAAVAAGLWWLRGESSPQATAGERPAPAERAAGGPRPGSGPGPFTPGAGGVRDAGPGALGEGPPRDPDPEPSGVGVEMSMGEVMASARERVTETVRPCWPEGRGDQVSHERVVVRYTLEISDGWAFARDVTVVDSDMQDTELQECVVDHLTGLSWEAPGAPEISRSMQTAVSTRDLTR